ncbi:MAG: SusC/RagA family TonB-linked outer membrane protein [Bacteroidales bacterium]|nr:SusC/RagA family TonB-linked outer membrane protein [Bacteroidales bacterium]
MRKFTIFLALMLFIGLQVAHAQRTITGKVTGSDDGAGIPGATVLVKGTAIGTITDIEGAFTLEVPKGKEVVLVSYVGMVTQELKLGNENVVNVVLEPSIQELEGVVVTALGIPREKKSLGYATQEVKGDQVNMVKTDNFVNSLAGRIAGVQVKTTTNMGGSTNILLRGNKSLTGNNQALFVVDGVPINNDVTNTRAQEQAGTGYDFGNAASDINPENIESINVLKGAAATALYGSRAANGVIMITTKKGIKIPGIHRKGAGVTFNSTAQVGFVDKSTFVHYQKDYGGGYGQYYDGPGGYWYMRYINTDGTITVEPKDENSKETQWVVTSEDASYGAKFDNQLVYQWDAVDPQSPNYLKPTPWKNADNGPITFFEKPVTFTNTLAIDNTFKGGSYRLSYTNFTQNGLLPNSKLVKNNASLNATWNVNDRLTVTGYGAYSLNQGSGRNSTGYNDNIMGSFRQWYQTNVDIKQQKELYDLTLRNLTWNYSDPSDAKPIYWDNPYWTRYQNYEKDSRNRFIGNAALTYIVADWFNIFGRISVDTYSELQEERRAVGSVPGTFGIGTGPDGSIGRSDQESGYMRRDINFSEFNYDVMGNFNKDLSNSFNLKGIVGMNIRKTNYSRMISATNGGLSVPELYSLQNSAGPLPLTKELASIVKVVGLYASVSLGYKNFLYLDGTIRRDQSSTLPVDNNSYFYPSVAGSFIFSSVIPEAKWLSFGKIRLNYARVGNSPNFDQLVDNYLVLSPFNNLTTAVPTTQKNPELKPENTNSIEGGLEMYFFGRRLGFDLALYKTNTIDQILPLPVTTATGYNIKVINAGEIQNQGIELALHATPVKLKNFRWDVTLNWSKNYNEVLSLLEGVKNLQLGRFQGGVTINAKVGEPYGAIYGTDYVYNTDHKRIIDPSNGRYQRTATSDKVIGNVNPDWQGGLVNTLTYKNWALNFLIDFQSGGDIFSLDMYYGLATGLYEETSYLNDLGNPVRDPIVWVDPNDKSKGYASNSGGFINEGVNPDGKVNTTRIAASNYGSFGYARLPNKAFVYDATYVKLRQVSLSYSLPSAILEKSFITGVTLTATAANLWIIFKNMPHADPESGLGAGNLQGYSTGSLPTTRDFSLNLKLTF